MGPSQQKPATSHQDNEYQILTIKHPRFNNMKIITVPTEEDEGSIQITIPLPNQSQFLKWDKKVKQVGQFQNIFLPINQKFTKTEFCGSGGIATIQFKYYPYLLSDQIFNRCSMEGKHFEQPELWYLVYSMIQAGNTFHSKKLKLGDVRPENIFISPEGQVRVSTQYSWPAEQTNYQKTVFQKQVTYLSPEQLRDISYGKLQETDNFSESQSFSVGLTCLDAATLSDSRQFYLENNKFSYSKLQEKLQQLQTSTNLSEVLILIIKGLCQVQSQKRARCEQLAGWLQKYEESIIDLQQFQIQQIPLTLQNLRAQKQRDSRAIRQINAYSQPISQIQPANYQSVPTNANQNPIPIPQVYTGTGFSKLIQQQVLPPISQLPQQYYTSTPIYQQVPSQNPTYINSVPIQNFKPAYQEAVYTQVTNNNSAVGYPRYTNQRSGSGVVEVQLTNQNPQIKPSLNLQQIDEQLQMSRKLFPS